ncbi:MAG: MtaA/CmuA family methyltransferase [Candidatus Omnitrophica bacterium]|nr:MtaA/CmuA family methyltransferase [Candidatus Omnitrophota bacterium]
MSRELFLKSVVRENDSGMTVFGTGTSIVCRDVMESVKTYLPQGHIEPEAMFNLALAGHTLLGFDVVMPLFSTCHEAASMGCSVKWGGPEMMPESGGPIFKTSDDINIPADLLARPGCAVPLKAIAMLRKELGDEAAVCGKVFGSWTQAYHYFGIENFLIKTITEPDEVKRILEKLMPVTIQFAQAQIEAGADCILLGDHATRDLCSPSSYKEFLMDMHAQLADAVKAPLILHICGNTSDRISYISRTGLPCFHWDTKTGSPQEVRNLAGEKLSLMGGISNLRLLNGTPDEIAEMAFSAACADIDIIGPECAIPLTTPLANLKAITSIGRKKRIRRKI